MLLKSAILNNFGLKTYFLNSFILTNNSYIQLKNSTWQNSILGSIPEGINLPKKETNFGEWDVYDINYIIFSKIYEKTTNLKTPRLKVVLKITVLCSLPMQSFRKIKMQVS